MGAPLDTPPTGPRNDYHIDVTAMLGLLVLGVIGIIAVFKGADGNTVAAAVVGGIAGWLAKASSKTANVTGDNVTVQPEGGQA